MQLLVPTFADHLRLVRFESLDACARADAAKRLMPEIRGRISKDERKIGHFTAEAELFDGECGA